MFTSSVAFCFSASGGLVHEFEESAVVRLDGSRHILSTLLQTGSWRWKASVHWSASLWMHMLWLWEDWCRPLNFVSPPADDYRRTACTSLLRYVVERAGGGVENDRTSEIYQVKQPQGKNRAYNHNTINFNYTAISIIQKSTSQKILLAPVVLCPCCWLNIFVMPHSRVVLLWSSYESRHWGF